MLKRLAQFTGSFYPQNPVELKNLIQKFFNIATVSKTKTKPKALLVPHAGYIYSGLCAAYGYKTIEKYNYKNIILIGPSHVTYFEGLISTSRCIWETPLGEINVYSINELLPKKECIQESFDIFVPEHSLEVQIPFLQYIYKDFIVFPILVGDIDFLNIFNILAKLDLSDSLIIISSDLSHYLPLKENQMQDKISLDAIKDLDSERFDKLGDACNKNAVSALLKLADYYKWQSLILYQSNSSNVTNDTNSVVGYASVIFY